MDTGQFVQLFHGNAAAHFRIIKPGFARSLQGTLPEVSEVLRRHNDDQCGVYLVINRGGTRKKDISAVTAVFADFDDVPKPEILKRLAAPKLHPTLLVESRRGYHVYWLLDEPYTGIDRLEVFEKVQRGISSLLGSDPRIVSAEHLMALPGFLNWKDPASPFLVEVRECSGAVYSVTELKAAFSVEAEDGLDVKASVLAPVKGVHPEADPPQSQDQQERKGGFRWVQVSLSLFTPRHLYSPFLSFLPRERQHRQGAGHQSVEAGPAHRPSGPGHHGHHDLSVSR